jgi:hypothetical protein
MDPNFSNSTDDDFFQLFNVSEEEEEEQKFLSHNHIANNYLQTTTNLDEEIEYINESNNKIFSSKEKLDNIDEVKLDEKLYVIRDEIRRFKKEILYEIRRLKSNRKPIHRDPKDQCGAINRKGKRCQGYICKKSKHLCYAHRIIARKSHINSHLYQKQTQENQETPGSIILEEK